MPQISGTSVLVNKPCGLDTEKHISLFKRLSKFTVAKQSPVSKTLKMGSLKAMFTEQHNTFFVPFFNLCSLPRPNVDQAFDDVYVSLDGCQHHTSCIKCVIKSRMTGDCQVWFRKKPGDEISPCLLDSTSGLSGFCFDCLTF